MQEYLLNRERLRKLLSDLIRINSVNPSLAINRQGESVIARYLGNYLDEIGIDPIYQAIKTNRINVIGRLRGQGDGPMLLLTGHTDTVGVDRMDIYPFDPRFEGGRLYGRGALDMKAGIAAQVLAVETLIHSGIRLRGDVILAFVADEEYASIGTEELLKTVHADGAILCEPTGLQIMVAHQGYAWARIEVFGKASYGSRPDEGIDAILKAGKVLCGIDRIGREILPQKRHPLLGTPSIHASLIQGGTEPNLYPDYCKIELERRTLPGESRKTVEAELREMMAAIESEDPGFRAHLEVYFYRPAYEVSQEEPVVRALEKAFQKVDSRAPSYSGSGGWFESALLADGGIPTVVFGPTGSGMHGPDEWVDFDSVVTTSEVLIETILEFCGVAG